MNIQIDQSELKNLLKTDNINVSLFEKDMIQEGIRKYLVDGFDEVSPEMIKFLEDYKVLKDLDLDPDNNDDIIDLSKSKYEIVNYPNFMIDRSSLSAYIMDAGIIDAQNVTVNTYTFDNMSDFQDFVDSNLNRKLFFYINHINLTIYHDNSGHTPGTLVVRCAIV